LRNFLLHFYYFREKKHTEKINKEKMSHHHYQIVIIGAGMAGLSAYLKFQEAGFQNILLLEASERIGGRIHTIPLRKKRKEK
jgi:monoamine oxidase